MVRANPLHVCFFVCAKCVFIVDMRLHACVLIAVQVCTVVWACVCECMVGSLKPNKQINCVGSFRYYVGRTPLAGPPFVCW